jgi:hypothetical protein
MIDASGWQGLRYRELAQSHWPLVMLFLGVRSV